MSIRAYVAFFTTGLLLTMGLAALGAWALHGIPVIAAFVAGLVFAITGWFLESRNAR